MTQWWNKHIPSNIVDVRSTEEFVALLAEAANLDRRTGRARLVCVEFFAGWCFACRSMHPKFCKIAANEFPDVLFLRVHKDELPDLCDALGVTKLPYVQLYKGVDGVVDEFAMNNSAPNLAKFRRALTMHRDGCQSLEHAHKGPAHIIHTEGWPTVYTGAYRRTFRDSALSYYSVKGTGHGRRDGLPRPGEIEVEVGELGGGGGGGEDGDGPSPPSGKAVVYSR